ncbi:hypothetical protein EC844_102197 [Acinetobacter calcoaceticus]|uniref:Uncharacterized protein n=1 Tax=Acinetobacter calcoaceticus TaxID=471 RepID=A0A4R1XYV7_ACICA|nr:hypothetical protein EC844_102197 [Acinetobacter calcoaceticus]
MKMFNKIYLNALNPLSLFLALHLFSVTTQAQATNLDAEAQKNWLPAKLETSNIQTDGYRWVFEITPNKQAQTFSVKLLNPHPSLTPLNKRSTDIAQSLQYEDIQNFILREERYQQEAMQRELKQQESKQPTQSASAKEDKPTEKKTAPSIDQVYFSVKFSQNYGYEKRKPNFNETKNYVARLCTTKTEQQSSSLINDQQRTFKIELNWQLSSEGKIVAMQISPPIHDQEFLNKLNIDIKNVKFNSINYNGVPITYRAQQPVDYICPKPSRLESMAKFIPF